MRSIAETINEKLRTVDERTGRYLLVGPDAYDIYTFKDYLKYLKKADKTKTYHTFSLLEDDDVPTSVSASDVWDVYYKNGKWLSYNEDYDEIPVKEWTLTDDDYVIDIHTEL